MTAADKSPVIARISFGKGFELQEKREWLGVQGDRVTFEASLSLQKGRRGRVDILVDEGGWFSIIEVKASDWDSMAEHRFRPNLLRHVRQTMKYIHPFWEKGIDVCLGLAYPHAPKSGKRRRALEAMLEERCIQVVWVDERGAE